MAVAPVGWNEFSTRVLGTPEGINRLFSLIKSLVEGVLFIESPLELPTLTNLRDRIKTLSTFFTGVTALPARLEKFLMLDKLGHLKIYKQDKCEAIENSVNVVIGICQFFDFANDCIGFNFSEEAVEISSSIYRFGTVVVNCCTVVRVSPELFDPLKPDNLKPFFELILSISKAAMMILYKSWKQTYGYLFLSIVYGYIGVCKVAENV